MTRAILAVDCTQRETVLAVGGGGVGGDAVRERRFLSAGSDGHERYYDELRALEREAGLSPADLGAVAVATGPGGFTGLRVSIAFAKGVAFARGIPAVAVPSALLLAASSAEAGEPGPWLVALATKGATAHATVVGRGAVESSVAAIGEAGALLGGEALLGAAESVAVAGGVVIADEHLDPGLRAELARRGVGIRPFAVSSAAFIRVARAMLERGGAVDPLELAPIYAREPEAVTKWRERAAAGPGAPRASG